MKAPTLLAVARHCGTESSNPAPSSKESGANSEPARNQAAPGTGLASVSNYPAVAGFMAAIPISIGLGAPVSTAFLELDGVFGLAGWRWLLLWRGGTGGHLWGDLLLLPDRSADQCEVADRRREGVARLGLSA
jgi:hypothetical protein